MCDSFLPLQESHLSGAPRPSKISLRLFRHREDRRHERDPGMQKIKEKFAWDGTLPEATDTTESIWTVDADVMEFVLDG